ncbi:hypothetical protein FNU76_06725 [Chitinimonas arctica]|uniref:Uncharacterized protein n=1 Tax=Chitinimonas arctica TaxID=2594795 RepID=A0A516SD36_9NEIS|nr:hypothetical protein [Chitinimonas arctica]QDQ26067.1 hypothetical protein FNU76_06725 [Chitinimonas arctica]
MNPPLQIELTAPQTVDSLRAPYQSLWLLVKLCRARLGGSPDGLVRLAELRQQFADTRSLRMLVSRAYRDFARWGVKAGWGDDPTRDPRFLNPDGRSQGPFWLPGFEAARIVLNVEGRSATLAELNDFLGVPRHTKAGKQTGVQDIAYWLALAGRSRICGRGACWRRWTNAPAARYPQAPVPAWALWQDSKRRLVWRTAACNMHWPHWARPVYGAGLTIWVRPGRPWPSCAVA